MQLLCCFTLALLGPGCSREREGEEGAQLVRVTAGAVAPGFTLCTEPLRIVYVDPENLTLSIASPGADGPGVRATVLDQIADVPEPSATFASHACVRLGGELHLFYLDATSEESAILKHIWKADAEEQWNVGIVTPPGRPLWALADRGTLHLFYERDGLLHQRLDEAQMPAADLLDPLARPDAQVQEGSGFKAGGFSYWDLARSAVTVVTLEAGVPAIRRLPAAGTTHHVRLARDGSMHLLCYERRTSQIVDSAWDARATEGVEPSRLLVTLARDVGALWSAETTDGVLYLYSELASDGKRGADHAISALWVPDDRQLAARRRVLFRSPVAVSHLRAWLRDRELGIAVLSDGLYYVRALL